MKWLIVLLILLLVLLTLNFSAVTAWMTATFTFVTATTAGIILLAVMLVAAVVLAILFCTNEDWFSELCAEVGEGAKAIVSGVASGVTNGIFGNGVGKLFTMALVGVGGYFGLKLFLDYRNKNKNSQNTSKKSNGVKMTESVLSPQPIHAK